MYFDITTLIYERSGEVMKDANDKEMTFSKAIVMALDGIAPGEKLTGEDKIKRFLLSCRIHEAKLSVELTIEEAALIKKQVDLVFPSPLIVAPIWIALEKGSSNEQTSKKVSSVR